MGLTIVNHPIVQQALAELREQGTSTKVFREACRRINLLLAVEATRDFREVQEEVTTPLEKTPVRVLAEIPVVVAILRAGIGMVDPFVELFPSAPVGYVGMERDEATAEARCYYSKLPLLRNRPVILVDPMLATGGSAVSALEILFENGAKDVRLVCVVAAPEGLQRLERVYPEIPVFVAALDRELNARKFIVPGLGDFGDRLFGT